MTDKKQRAPRQLTAEQIAKQIEGLGIQDKLFVLKYCEQEISSKKKALEEQIALINGKG